MRHRTLHHGAPHDLSVFHAIPSIAMEHGGPSQSLSGLLNAMSNRAVKVHLACSRALQEPGLSPKIDRTEVQYAYRRFWCPTPGSIHRIGLALDRVDVVHIHSYWNGIASILIALACKKCKPVVLSPRGCLQQQAIQGSARLAKLLYSALIGQRQLSRVSGYHFQTETEAEASIGIEAQPLTIIDNGVALPDLTVCRRALRTKLFANSAQEMNLVFLGRIARIKGIDLQIRALRLLHDRGQSAHLHLIGPNGGDRARLQNLARQLGVAGKVCFHGPVYSEEKSHWLQAADAVLMSSEFENNSNAALETMAAGGVLITTKGILGKGPIRAQAALSVPRTAEDLAGILTKPLDPRIRRNARAYVQENHGWDSRATKMLKFYKSLL